MKRKILSLITICIASFSTYAQMVGINTDNPTSTLDVNGSLRTTGNILVGGDDSNKGLAGNAGDFLVSQGEGLAPKWAPMTFTPPNNGDYFLKTSVARTDTKGGLLIPYTLEDSPVKYPEDELISKRSPNWVEIEDFRLVIPAFTKPSRVVINFQAIFQTKTTDIDDWLSFSVAVFVDKLDANGKYVDSEMKAVRSGGCYGANNAQNLFTLTSTLDNLPANQINTIRIAAIRRNSNVSDWTNSVLAVGRDLPTAPIDESIGKVATFRADIFEKVK